MSAGGGRCLSHGPEGAGPRLHLLSARRADGSSCGGRQGVHREPGEPPVGKAQPRGPLEGVGDTPTFSVRKARQDGWVWARRGCLEWTWYVLGPREEPGRGQAWDGSGSLRHRPEAGAGVTWRRIGG